MLSTEALYQNLGGVSCLMRRRRMRQAVPAHRRDIYSNGPSKPAKAQTAASACEWVNTEKG